MCEASGGSQLPAEHFPHQATFEPDVAAAPLSLSQQEKAGGFFSLLF